MEDKMVVTALTAKIWSEQSTFLKQLVKNGVIDDKAFIDTLMETFGYIPEWAADLGLSIKL